MRWLVLNTFLFNGASKEGGTRGTTRRKKRTEEKGKKKKVSAIPSRRSHVQQDIEGSGRAGTHGTRLEKKKGEKACFSIRHLIPSCCRGVATWKKERKEVTKQLQKGDEKKKGRGEKRH